MMTRYGLVKRGLIEIMALTSLRGLMLPIVS